MATKRQLSRHQPVGRWIRVDKRLAIYLRDGFRCGLCDRDLHGAAPADITLDHVIPKSRGGSNRASNLYTCCRSCNSWRADRALAAVAGEEAIARIRRWRRRKLDRYRQAAKAILRGELDGVDDDRAYVRAVVRDVSDVVSGIVARASSPCDTK